MASFDGNGLVIDRLADIKSGIQQDMRSVFGDGINLSEESPIGVIIGIMSERYYLLWEKLEAVYLASYPDLAYGNYLDYLCAFNGVIREAASYSAVDLVFTRSNAIDDGDVLIEAGTQVTVVGSTTIWETRVDTVIPDGEMTVSTPARPQKIGKVNAVANTLTNMLSVPANVASVTNPEAATPGLERETDAALRARRWTELGRLGTSTETGIRSALQALDIVGSATIILNDTDVEVNGQPPHSIACYAGLVNASSGDEDTRNEIAQTIWNAKGAGINTYGDLSGTAIDTNGDSQTVYFSEVEVVPIHVEVTMTVDAQYDLAQAELAIKEALVNYSDTQLNVGVDVVNYKIEGVVANIGVVGIEYLSTKIKKEGGVFGTTNLTIDPEQTAAIVDTNITFVYS